VHADARVAEPDAFRVALLAAAGWADATGGLATVGLTPTVAASGLGYIELGAACDPAAWRRPAAPAPAALLGRAAGLEAYSAVRFVEKPDRAAAERYLSGGRHLWNLALFAWRAPVFLHELRSAAPDVAAAAERVVELRLAGDEAEATREYTALPVAPVEPLLLERGAPLTAVRAAFAWSDVGSWSDLHDARVEAGEADRDGNVVDGDVLTVGARGSTVVARGNRLVAVVGADSLVVVDTPDALLVVPSDRAQLVKDAVERLRDRGRSDVL
jgi:mannose-1-phosphate guanylyltransferase